MFLTLQANTQGYERDIISGVFTLLGVVLGSLVTVILNRQDQKRRRKEEQEDEVRSIQKQIYTEMLQIHFSLIHCFAQLEKGISKDNIAVAATIEKLYKYIETTGPNASIYAKREIWDRFLRGVGFANECISNIDKYGDAYVNSEQYNKLRGGYENEMGETVMLIKKDLGIS